MILGGVLFCSVGYWNRKWFQRIRRRFYGVLLPLGLLLYLVPMILAPGGGTADGRVRNCFLRGQGTFPRYSPWNVIPESDQLRVGMCLAPAWRAVRVLGRGRPDAVARASNSTRKWTGTPTSVRSGP